MQVAEMRERLRGIWPRLLMTSATMVNGNVSLFIKWTVSIINEKSKLLKINLDARMAIAGPILLLGGGAELM